MKHLLIKLHHTKMLLAGLLIGVAGVLMLAMGQLTAGSSPQSWLSLMPWSELGGILVGAGVLGIWLDHYLRAEQEALTDQRLRSLLDEHAPAMRDAVLQAFAANHEDLARVATPTTLDRIATNALALRLDDADFARDIWTDIRSQAIEAAERRTNATATINLSPAPKRPGQLLVTVRWEYTTRPRHLRRRFVCLSDRSEYAELVRARDGTTAWFRPDDELQASDTDAFELLQFAVDGQERKIRRTARKHYQAYTVDLATDPADDAEKVIAYTFRTITPAHGHLLFFDIEQPTRDVSITFDHTGCDFSSVSVIDQVPATLPSRIERSPDGAPVEQVRVEIDGWVFPRAGVAFVWTAHGEARGNSQRRSQR